MFGNWQQWGPPGNMNNMGQMQFQQPQMGGMWQGGQQGFGGQQFGGQQPPQPPSDPPLPTEEKPPLPPDPPPDEDPNAEVYHWRNLSVV